MDGIPVDTIGRILVECEGVMIKGEELKPGDRFKFGPYWCQCAATPQEKAVALKVEIQKERGYE